MRWMNLEPIIQSEGSQKEKDKYHRLKHIYGIQKDGTDEFICKAAMGEADIENRLMDMGRGEERVRCIDSNMQTYITICKRDDQCKFDP